MKNKIINLNLFFLAFFPIAIATGTFIPNLIVTIAALSLIFLFQKDENFKQYFLEIIQSNLILILITFSIVIIFSSLLSDMKLKSLESSLFYFRYIFFGIIGSYILSLKSKYIILISKGIIFSFLLVFIKALLEFSLEISFLSGNYDTLRLELFDDEAVVGSFIARLAPLFTLSLFLNFRKSNFLNLILIAGIVSSGFFIFISGERTAFFYFLLFALTILVSNIFTKKLKILIFTSIFFIISIVILTSDKTKQRMISSSIIQMFGENNISFNGFSEQHNSHYKTAIKIFNDHKIIGSGPKTFRYLCKDKNYQFDNLSCSTHPHNTYIQLLAETGILGFAFVLIIFLFLIKKIISVIIFEQNRDNQLIELCILISFLITLWPFSPTNNFFGSWFNNIFYFPLIFYLLNKFKPINTLKNEK